jgi:hypothetical protein
MCQHIKGKNLNGKLVPVHTTKTYKRRRTRMKRRRERWKRMEEEEELQLHSFTVKPNGWI